VPVRVVTVPTLVLSRDDRVLNGLQTSDFRILDNGRRQTVTLDTTSTPFSLVLAIQTNRDVRNYLSFISKTGAMVDDMLVGESGEAAVITYAGEVDLIKDFAEGDCRTAFKKISPWGERSRAIDAGLRAVAELARRPATRSRVLLFVGQGLDRGSTFSFDYLRKKAEQANITVFALTLPVSGKTLVRDSFRLHKITGAPRGGFKLGLDFNYGRVLSALKTRASSAVGIDPFSRLTAATGGTEIHFGEQRELEDALTAIGFELRSLYALSYHPGSAEPGYHAIKVEVRVQGAKAFSRPGYWRTAD
jgi:VWFA-related protein